MLTEIVDYILNWLGYTEEPVELELVPISPHAALDAILEDTCDCNPLIEPQDNPRDYHALVAKEVAQLAFARIETENQFNTRAAVVDYILSVTPDLTRVAKMPRYPIIQLSGSTQTQKTSVAIGLILLSVLKGVTAVAVVRDYTCDAVQLQTRIREYLTKLALSLPRYSHILNFFTVIRADKLRPANKGENIPARPRPVIEVPNPCCIIALGNDVQLNSVLEAYSQSPFPFNLIIDENDEVDCGSGSKTCKVLDRLRENCSQEYGITATPLDVVANRAELVTTSFVNLTNPPDYRGHSDIEVHELRHHITRGIYSCLAVSFDNMCEGDANLPEFLEYFSKSLLTFSSLYNKLYPNICLLKVTDFTDLQSELYNNISHRYPSLVVIESNAAGFRVSRDWVSPLNGAVISAHSFHTSGVIADVLQALKNAGDVIRILIIAGRKAKRSQSFTTRDYDWHLTDMYYVPSRGTTIPTMWQDTGRLTGRNKGKSHLRLYCSKEVSEAVRKGILLTQELLERSVNRNSEEPLPICESLRSVNVTKSKLPKRRLCNRSTSKLEFGVVNEGDDDGWSVELYE